MILKTTLKSIKKLLGKKEKKSEINGKGVMALSLISTTVLTNSRKIITIRASFIGISFRRAKT